MLWWAWVWEYLFELLFLFPLDKYSEMDCMDRIIVLALIFWGISKLFSIVAAPIYIPINSEQWFPFIHILTNTVTSCVFDSRCFNRDEVISHCGFNLQVPDECLLIFLLAICMSSLENCLLVEILFIFKIRLFVVFVSEL